MMPAINVQDPKQPLSFETIILANMTAPEDVRAYVMLVCFMIMTHNQKVIGREDTVEDVIDWTQFPLEYGHEAELPASLTLEVLTALSVSPLLSPLLIKSHRLFEYPDKPQSPDALAVATREHYKAIRRVVQRVHMLFSNMALLSLAP